MDKDTPNIALDTSCVSSMEIVMKNIYTSCDPHNLNMVPTSEIIEFIRPYMLEANLALETLRNMLDPESKNVSVTSENFFNVMNEWTQKIASHTEAEGEGDFNRTPSQLHVLDEKSLPYTQSTPRPSFGQKLLNCEGLLNLSNVSGYNLSPTKQAKDISISVPEKTILEEEVKQLQYQLNKVLGEIEMLRVQLAFSEDQNEALQEQLEKCKMRSQSGQPVNENVQENKICMDELREEIVLGKKRIEELNKKLMFYEKDNMHLNQYTQKLEKENLDLEEHFAKTKQNMENEIFGLRTELEIKDHEISTVSKINEELRIKLYEKMTELEQVLTENEVLDYKQQDLEKLLSSKRYSLSSHYNSCLDDMSSFLARGNTIPIYSSPIKNKSIPNSPLTKKVLSPTPKMLYQVLNSSTPKNNNGVGMRKSFSLNTMSTRSLPNIFCFERSNVVQDQADGGDESQSAIPNVGPFESLQTELFQVDPQFDHKDKNGIECDYEDQILSLKTENEYLQKKIEKIEEENKVLTVESSNVQDKAKELERKLSNLMLEKEEIKTETTKHLEEDINKLKSILDDKEQKICQLEQKFDFEPVYKNLEMDFGKKVAQIDQLQKTVKLLQSQRVEIKEIHNTNDNNENFKKDLQEKNTRIKQLQDVIRKESDVKNEVWKENENLRKQLEGVEKEKIEIMEKLGDSKDFEKKLQERLTEIGLKCDAFETKEINNENLKKELQEKNTRIQQLQDVIRKETDVKNEVWRENEDLRKQLKGVEKEKIEIMEKLGDSEDFGKNLQERLTEIGLKCDAFETKEINNENLKKELQEKDIRIKQLQDVIRKESDVKNEVCRENEDLRKLLEGVEKEKIEILEKLGDSEDFGKKLQERITEIGLKCDGLELKLKEELEKNLKLQTQLSLLKIEADEIRENQKYFKEEIMKKLTEYEGSLHSFHCKIKYFENENNLLKMDIETQRSTECEDSGVRSELEERSKKYTDEDVSSESSVSFALEKPLRLYKNRSFEKQKLTIDKLREELRQEKYKNETLKEKLIRENEKYIRENEKFIRENEKFIRENEKFIQENEKLKTGITDSDKKLNQQEDYYKHICNAATEKINILSEELTTLNEKNKKNLIIINEKENLLKGSYEAFEYNKNMLGKLEKEVYDFKIIQNKLTADLAGKEMLLKNVSVENHHLKLAVRCSNDKLVELSSRVFKQESELNDYRLDLDKKREETASLSMVLSDRDRRIEDLCAAAKAYDVKMSNVMKELVEKEEACAKLEDKFKILNEKFIKTTDTTVPPEKLDKTNLDIEMDTINGHINKETVLDKISNFTDIISECCQELNGAFTTFIDQWRKKIESHPNFKHLPYIKLCQSSNVEDVLSVIIDNIKTVIMLLDITSSKNTKTMDNDTETLQDFLTNRHNTNSVDSKNIKKFTLRPATLQLSRPTSPDSPGIEITEDEKSDSPDSRNIRKNFDKTEEGENERYTDLSILSFDLPIQDAFPHISDTILEKLGLHEGSPKVKLTKEETEEVFTTFAIQIGLDSKDIRDRLQKQKNTCTQKYKKYQYLLKDVSKRLREHNCIGSMDSINPVFVMLEDVRYMMQDLLQSAGKLGVLTCEFRMTKCWNLVTTYMAILKQDLEDTKSSTNISAPVRTKSSLSTDVKFISRRSKIERNKVTKENKSTCRSCLSILMFIMFVIFLLLIIAIGIHWQCKMTTEYKICALDDFIRMITQRVGSPPY